MRRNVELFAECSLFVGSNPLAYAPDLRETMLDSSLKECMTFCQCIFKAISLSVTAPGCKRSSDRNGRGAGRTVEGE